MTKMDERFISKLELHIMHRMLNGEKLYEFIESFKLKSTRDTSPALRISTFSKIYRSDVNLDEIDSRLPAYVNESKFITV